VFALARNTAADRERDAQALDLYTRGLTYRQIAAQLTMASPSTAHAAVQRAVAAVPDPAKAMARRIALQRLAALDRAAWRVLTRQHYVTGNTGQLAYGPDGQPLTDDAPVLQAIDRLLRIEERRAKTIGTDTPVPTRQEITISSELDGEIEDLLAQLTGNVKAPAPSGGGGGSLPAA
jgi:hypothetical protein